MSVLHQAIDSITGDKFTWLAETYDHAATGYPGPNQATNLIVLAGLLGHGAGPQGPQGDAGPEGPEGPTGPPGPDLAVGASGSVYSSDGASNFFTSTPSVGSLTALHLYTSGLNAVTASIGGVFIASDGADLNGQLIQNVAGPIGPNDAATKSYVDAVSVGLQVKTAVAAIATANVATLSGLATTVDGVALTVDSTRVLLAGQSTASQNGVYLVHSGAWTRSTDMAAASHAAGSFVFVTGGTSNANSGWVCSAAAGSDVVGTNSLPFSQFSAAGQVSATLPIVKTGTVLSLNAATGSTAGSMSAADKTKLDGMAIAGTSGKIAKFTGTGAVGNSIVTDTGTALQVAGPIFTTGYSGFGGIVDPGANVDTPSFRLRVNPGIGKTMQSYADGTGFWTSETPGFGYWSAAASIGSATSYAVASFSLADTSRASQTWSVELECEVIARRSSDATVQGRFTNVMLFTVTYDSSGNAATIKGVGDNGNAKLAQNNEQGLPQFNDCYMWAASGVAAVYVTKLSGGNAALAKARIRHLSEYRLDNW
jgi:hypothetical protein